MSKTTNKTKTNPHLPPDEKGKNLVDTQSHSISTAVPENQKSLENEGQKPSGKEGVLDPIAEGKGKPMPGREGGAEDVKRHSLKIVDGKFDFEAIRSGNEPLVKEAFKNSVADPDFRKWAGLSVADTPEGQQIPPPMVGMLFDSLTQIGAAMLAKKSGLEFKEVYPVVQLTKAEHGMLDEQGAKLIEKYIPTGKYSDVVIFGMTVLAICKNKASQVEMLQIKSLDSIANAPEPAKVTPTGAVPVSNGSGKANPAPQPPPNPPISKLAEPPQDANQDKRSLD